MSNQFPLLVQMSSFLYISMAVGYLATLVIRIKEKNYKEVLLLLIPFYVIKSILSMEEHRTKKLLSILVMGALLLWVIIQVIIMVLTPPI